MNLKKLSPITIKVGMAIGLAVVFVIALIIIVFGEVYGRWIGALFFILISIAAIYEFSGLVISSKWWRIYLAIVPILIVFIFPIEEISSLTNTNHQNNTTQPVGDFILSHIKNQFIFYVAEINAMGYLIFSIALFIPFGFIYYKEKKEKFEEKLLQKMIINFLLLGLTIFSVTLTIKFLLYWTIYKFSIGAIVIAGIICCDVFAYFVGISLGKQKGFNKKLAPKISPNKTIVGFIGGYIASFLLLFLSLYFSGIFKTTFKITEDINLLLILLTSFVVPIMAVIGDLAFSFVKRKFNVKDYSSLLPGHGGILDRFDSTIYAFIYFNLMLVIVFQIVY